MPKEVFLEIIQKGLYLNFALIIIAHTIGHLVLQKLILRLNNSHAGAKKLAPVIIGGVIYTLTGKQFLPNIQYVIVLVIFFTCLACLIYKTKIVRTFFAVFAVLLLVNISEFAIMQPLVLYNKNLLLFIIGTPLGVALGSLIEIIIPAIVLLFLSTFKIHMQIAKSKTSLLDFFGIVLFALAFFTVYYLVALFVWTSQHNSDSPVPILLLELILLTIAGLIFFYVFKHSFQKHLFLQHKLTEMEHSNRLLETIYSERREYQNNLQVMKIMAAMGVTQELEDYMGKIIVNILKTGGITRISDPILAATLITYQIKAKEYNIPVVINCKKTLKDIDHISLQLKEVFNIFLELLLESLLAVKGPDQEIIIEIEEGPAGYSFDFKTGETTTVNPKKKPVSPTTVRQPDYSEKLASAEKIIKELGGDFYPVIVNDRILRLRLTIDKNRANYIKIGSN